LVAIQSSMYLIKSLKKWSTQKGAVLSRVYNHYH
jgi:hypothetical protein